MKRGRGNKFILTDNARSLAESMLDRGASLTQVAFALDVSVQTLNRFGIKAGPRIKAVCCKKPSSEANTSRNGKKGETYRLVLEALESGNESMAEIARRLSVSRQRVDQIAHPDKHYARQTLTRAVAVGAIIRPSTCERCKVRPVHAGHHGDYSKPLEVEWLCTQCHTSLQRGKTKLHIKRKPVKPERKLWPGIVSIGYGTCEICKRDFSRRLPPARVGIEPMRFCNNQCQGKWASQFGFKSGQTRHWTARRKPKEYPPEYPGSARMMYESGLSIRLIAQALEIPVGTMKELMNRWNIPRRTTGETNRMLNQLKRAGVLSEELKP